MSTGTLLGMKWRTTSFRSSPRTTILRAFLAAAVPLTIVRTFEMSGICFVKNGAQLLCTIRPERAKLLLVPLPQILPELETDADDSDEAESQAYLEECAELLDDLESDEMHNPQ
jgi:hypothetical protein